MDNYHPDLLYSDGGVPFGNEVGLSMIAHFYNTSAALHGGQLRGRLQLQTEVRRPLGGGPRARHHAARSIPIPGRPTLRSATGSTTAIGSSGR